MKNTSKFRVYKIREYNLSSPIKPRNAIIYTPIEGNALV
jgi:hypothetical protein